MAKSILQIVIQTLKEGNADKETISSLKQMQSTIGTVTSVVGAMAGAYAVVDKVIGEGIRTTVDYASEVRKMTQLTGQSAEEASRVIQVMDDLKVGTDTLTMATKTLSKQGLSLNIETLAKLSDEYRKLGSGSEKTAFLVKNFGKTGLDMAEAMEKGGTALRSMNEAVDKNLVLSRAQVEAARQLEIEQDNLNDSWTAMKVQIGTAVIPAINDFLEARRAYIAAEDEARTHTELTGLQMDMLTKQIYEQNTTVNSAEQSYTAMARAMEGSTTAAIDMADAEKAAADAAKAITAENQTLLGVIGSLQSEENSYADQTRTLSAERKQIEADKAAAIAAGWSASSQKVKEYDAALAENDVKTKENADAHDLATKKIVLGLLQQKLAADGNLTDDEMNWLLEKGKAWGIYSQTVIDEARKAIAEANGVRDAINGIPSSKTIDITTNYYTNHYGQRDPSAAPGRDSGGPGVAGQAYVINPQAGPEVFVPSTSGNFYPNADRMLGGGSPITMSVVVNTLINSANDAQLMNALYPVFMMMIQRAKSDGVLK